MKIAAVGHTKMSAKKSETRLSENHFEVINIIYEMMNDPSLFLKFADRVSEITSSDKTFDYIENAIRSSGEIASKISSIPNVELSRDIGLLVVGLNRSNIVSHVPPKAKSWLGAKFIGNNEGIGWITLGNSKHNIAHILQLSNHKHLPIHGSIQSGLNTGHVSKLVVIHQFDLSEKSLEALKDLYKLTPAELRLCNHLAETKTLRQSAIASGVKVSTTKSHLKNIFQKIGIKSQLELIRLLTQISAATAIQEFGQRENTSIQPDWKNGLVSIQSNFITTRYGTRLAYSEFGDPNGKVVLFFHHGIGSRMHTRGMAEQAKEQKLHIYKFDRPGIGNSDLLPAMSIERVGNIVLDLIQCITDGNVSAIGYGVGGKTLLDILPHVDGCIDEVALYSYRGVSKSKSKTVMHKLTQLVWEKPNVMKSFLKIMQPNFSTESMRKNLVKYYQDSVVDANIIGDIKFAKERIEEIKLSIRQDCKGTIFDYLNLNQPMNVRENSKLLVPIRAIFGDQDKFNFPEDAKRQLSGFQDCQIFMSKGHGQLHLYNEFGVFLKSAFGNVEECPWLSEYF